MAFTYNKNDKLKSQKSIAQLFIDGKSVSAYPLRLVYLKHNDTLKVGVSVSKRNFKRAVDRIKIKRLLREAYRLNKPNILQQEPQHFAIMILYIGKDMPDYNLIDTKVKHVLTKFTQAVSNS